MRKVDHAGIGRPSEDSYLRVTPALDEGHLLIDVIFDEEGRVVDLVYLESSPAAASDMISSRFKQVANNEPHLHEIWGSVARTGKTATLERYSSQRRRWYDLYAFKPDPSCESSRVAIIFRDTTEQRRQRDSLRESEERQAFLLKLSDALRPLADPSEIKAVAARTLGQHLGAMRVSYGEVAEDGEHITHTGSYEAEGASPLAGRYRMVDFGNSLVAALQEGRAVELGNVASVTALDPSERAEYAQRGIVAIAGVPLNKGGRLVAILVVHHGLPWQWTPNELGLVNETAERTWAAVERARAEAALRESESSHRNRAAQLRAVLESINDAVYIADRDGVILVNQAALDQLGYTTREQLERDLGVHIAVLDARDANTGELIPKKRHAIVRALRGERLVQDMLIRRLSGEERVVRCSAAPVMVHDKVVAAVAVNTDVTDRTRAEEALKRSEMRFRAFVMASSDVVYRAEPDWSEIRPLNGKRNWGRDWLKTYVPPDDHAAVRGAIERAIRTESMFEQEHRVLRDDGTLGWMLSRAVPMLDERGEIKEWVGSASDVTARRQAQEHQAILLAELQHRVRNILAMVRSMVRRTMENAQSLAEVGALLDGRINALARTQALLTRAAGAGVDLEALIREELLGQGADERRVCVEGPLIVLAPKAAEVLTLAVHELATNATKYGAIGQNGSLSLTWAVEASSDGRDWLRLVWAETGVSVVSVGARRSGFGTELIERRVPYELNGRGRIDLRPGGLRAEITFPLVPGESILATNGPNLLGEEAGSSE